MADTDNYSPEIDSPYESSISLTHVAMVLRTYAAPILLATIAATIGYILFAVAYSLLQPVERYTTVGFRLEFAGAENGKYPNGVKFSGSDIIDTPILRTVHEANQLGRFMSFGDFSRSVAVLEANSAMDQLAREYGAKLSDPKLSPVDRERLEAEYAQKRESIRKSDYALSWTTRERLKRVPQAVTAKTLLDILRTWADFAANTRQVLLHRVPLVSASAISRTAAQSPDILASLLALRTSSRELQENIQKLAGLPGAEVIRSSKRNASLRELELEQAQLEMGIEYLIVEALANVQNRGQAVALIRAQHEYDRRALAAAEERVQLLRESLESYTGRASELSSATPAVAEPKPTNATGDQTLVLNDSFFDRVVALSQNAADREYRQRRADEIREAALATVPLRARVAYSEQLLERIAANPTATMSSPQISTERQRLAAGLAGIATDLVEIRAILSRSLTAAGQIYTITAPTSSVVERSVDTKRLLLGGILAMFLTLAAAIAVSFVHHHLKNDPRTD